MTEATASANRTLGLFQATSVGVGAIVGGGILALAGVAFATTGPSAILAFALNGVIALLTALSFAEMAAAFPESGGTYTFAKKVMTVRAAFAVGWVVWFASIVAAVLYALGFGAFTLYILQALWPAAPAWLANRWVTTGLALLATAVYAVSLARSGGGGGAWINVGKVLVFGILIAGGLTALFGAPAGVVRDGLRPFLAAGLGGLVQAMGYTFIALQGFDLIAAVAGEIRQPERTIPRAMLISLSIALFIYLPLLLVVSTVGLPGQDVQAASAAQPETIIAVAAQNYLGAFGYWLVLVAGVLSMLSALQANLYAASRLALTMARDRTLPHRLEQVDAKRGTPVTAVLVTSAIVMILLLILPDVAAAGAASSLIFLITFALAHVVSMLMRQRGNGQTRTFRTPAYPAIPLIGVTACVGLAAFQGVAVPAAGFITALWLLFGGLLFLALFARRAEAVDAAAEALDPDLLRLRGRSPLVLVPIANPANAASMVFVANALAPPNVGRVLLLSIVASPEEARTDLTSRIDNAQRVLQHSLQAALARDLTPEALTTIAPEPWLEIARVAQVHDCEGLLLGLSQFTDAQTAPQLERLASQVNSDVIVLRPPFTGWDVTQVKRVLAPVGGQGAHDALRARLLSSLWRTAQPEITFLQMLPEGTETAVLQKTTRALQRYAREEVPGNPQAQVFCHADVTEAITQEARNHDLVVLGFQRVGRRQRVFGDITRRVAQETNCAIILISRKS